LFNRKRLAALDLPLAELFQIVERG